MNKILLVLASFFAVVANGQYNLNLTTVSRTSTQITVAVQGNATTTALTIGGNGTGKGIVALPMTFNNAAVTVASIAIATAYSTTNYAVSAASFDNTAGTISFAATKVTGTAATFPVTPNWSTIYTVTFDIISTSQPLNLAFGTSDIGNNTITYTRSGAFDRMIYNGTTWSGGNGTAGAPASSIADLCKRLLVTSGNLTIATGQNIQCDYIAITSPATLTVAPGASITAWNLGLGSYVTSTSTFTIDADASGYGQFKGGAVALTAKQYWSPGSGRWINIGFPVTSPTVDLGGAPLNTNGGTSAICTPDGSGTWGNPVNTTNIYSFTSGSNGCTPTPAVIQHEWSGLSAAPAGGAGYNVFIASTGAFASTGIISASGTSIVSNSYPYLQSNPHLLAAATGAGSQSGTGNEANWNGWRLVANPFTCNLDVNEFATDNGISPLSISIWNGSSYVGGGSTVAPFQAFWIKLGSDQLFSFNAATQAVIGSATATKTSSLGNHVALTVTNGTTTSDAHLYFESLATLGFDNMYDGYKLINLAANTPNVGLLEEYVTTTGQLVRNPMGYNAVPTPVGPQAYPLIFQNITAENHTISIDPSVLPVGYTVAIEDKLVSPGVLNDITNSSYAFSHAGASADPLRFVLHVNAGSIGIEENALLEGLSAWVNQGQLHFSNDIPENAVVEVYNTAGQLVASASGNESLYIHQNGVYVVSIKTNGGETKNLKVVKM